MVPHVAEQAHQTSSFRLALSLPPSCTATVKRIPEFELGAAYQLTWVGRCTRPDGAPPQGVSRPPLFYFLLRNPGPVATNVRLQSFVTAPGTYVNPNVLTLRSYRVADVFPLENPSCYIRHARQGSAPQADLGALPVQLASVGASPVPPPPLPNELTQSIRAGLSALAANKRRLEELGDSLPRLEALSKEGKCFQGGLTCSWTGKFGPIQIPTYSVFYGFPQNELNLNPCETVLCELQIDTFSGHFDFINFVYSDLAPVVIYSAE